MRRAGRITLLLGPPSGGKSVLLQALSGRLRPGRKLRVRLRWGGWARATGAVGPQPAITLAGVLSRSMPPQLCALTPLQIRGSIKYNGIPLDEFQPRRTAGLVQQEDNHIAGRRIPGDGVGVVAACVWVWVCVGGVVCGFVCGWVGCVCVWGGGDARQPAQRQEAGACTLAAELVQQADKRTACWWLRAAGGPFPGGWLSASRFAAVFASAHPSPLAAAPRADLTVQETVEFASRCQAGQPQREVLFSRIQAAQRVQASQRKLAAVSEARLEAAEGGGGTGAAADSSSRNGAPPAAGTSRRGGPANGSSAHGPAAKGSVQDPAADGAANGGGGVRGVPATAAEQEAEEEFADVMRQVSKGCRPTDAWDTSASAVWTQPCRWFWRARSNASLPLLPDALRRPACPAWRRWSASGCCPTWCCASWGWDMLRRCAPWRLHEQCCRGWGRLCCRAKLGAALAAPSTRRQRCACSMFHAHPLACLRGMPPSLPAAATPPACHLAAEPALPPPPPPTDRPWWGPPRPAASAAASASG